jgi:hypothetical protein
MLSVTIFFKLYNECLNKETLEGFGRLKIRKIINTVKYEDDLVLQAKEEIVLQDMNDKLTEVERCYGMEMNVEKKVMSISRQSFQVKRMIDLNSYRMWNLLNI